MNMCYENELYHHGVKGMHWGIRKDRSGGAGGKKRFSTKEKAHHGYKDRKSMSDEEILRRIGRLEKEKRLMELERETDTRTSTWAKEVMKKSGKTAVATIAGTATLYAGKKALGKTISSLGGDGNAVLKEMFPKKK